jgi:putative methyltransferase (TIGR04325 family)
VISFLKDFYFQYWKRWGWFGNYASWAAAQADCSGYDEGSIFNKVAESARLVRNGKACFERDGALFYEKQEIRILKQNLQNIAQAEGSVRVLDFGGALGSLYYQHIDFLKGIPNLVWCVVEQQGFVDLGKSEFENENLKFESDFQAAVEKYKPNVLLAATVLQYLEAPYAQIDVFINHKFKHIFALKALTSASVKDRITKQIVHPKLYSASYPCWFFNLEKFTKAFSDAYTLKDSDSENYLNNIKDFTLSSFYWVRKG